jgi:5-methylcytosine-specific restriction endonuclease McrA
MPNYNKNQSPEYREACRIRSTRKWTEASSRAKDLVKGMCVYCYKNECEETHHIKLLYLNLDLAFNLDNLAPLCEKCHGFIHVRDGRGEDTERQIRDKMEKNIGVRSLKEIKRRYF